MHKTIKLIYELLELLIMVLGLELQIMVQYEVKLEHYLADEVIE
jgi:hypothetical protein